jgi:histidinol-phosphate aminotransferase
MTMNFDLNAILRPHILTLTPYASARDEYEGTEGIFLDANENPIGSITRQPYNRYPDPYQAAIKQKLAAIRHVRPNQIFLGNGSDEAIDLLIRATCTPREDEVILLPPTYGMYEVSAAINDVPVVRVPLTPDFGVDLPAVLGAVAAHPRAKLIFFCSPNNPTGNRLRTEDILRVLDVFPGLVVVDEAYIDFTGGASFVSRLDAYPNLVVLQTFSKAWGLASLRLGMAFASPAIIAILNKLKPPYNISGVTQQLVGESLDNLTSVEKMVGEILQQRDGLRDQLVEVPVVRHVYPSDANFMLVKVQDARAVYHFLVNRKIIVRDRSNVKLCEGCLRISVGTAEENRQLLTALREFGAASA